MRWKGVLEKVLGGCSRLVSPRAYPTAQGDKILEAERAEWMIVDGYADGVFLASNWAT